MAYGPGVNEINYTDLPPTGDTIASAAQKTQNQFDALYTGLNADIVRASAAEVNTAEDTTKIVTPGTLLKGKASGVASLNESGKVTETELPNASETVKGVVKVGSNINVDEGVVSVPEATDAVKGVVELATPEEVLAGTDNERAVTPAGFKAAFGEFYPIGAEPTYVDANNFTAAGDLTAIFTKGRVLKITDTGGTVYAVVSASVYDTVTTVTIAGDTIDSGISAVLYAVSQHTSAIWESGSNANGEYVKFVDGTLVCVINRSMSITTPNGTAPLYYSEGISITLPAAYIDDSFAVSGTTQTSSGLIMFCSFLPTSVETIGGYIVNDLKFTTPIGTKVRFMTIGRWY